MRRKTPWLGRRAHRLSAARRLRSAMDALRRLPPRAEPTLLWSHETCTRHAQAQELWVKSERDTGMRRYHTERSALTPLTRTSGRGPGFAKVEAQEEWLGSVRAGLSKECASSALGAEWARHRHAHRPLHGHAGMPLDGIERASVKAHPRQRRCGAHGPVTTALWSQTREISSYWSLHAHFLSAIHTTKPPFFCFLAQPDSRGLWGNRLGTATSACNSKRRKSIPPNRD